MPTALNDLLQATSRSFYLTLRVLPARVFFPACFPTKTD
jgi:phytoene/squalene synthetase